MSPKRSSVPCCSCPSPWLPATGARGEKPDCGAEVKCSCSPHPSTAVPCCAFLGLPCCWKRQLSVQPQLSKIAITVIIMPQSKHRWTTAGLKLVVGNTGEVYCFRCLLKLSSQFGAGFSLRRNWTERTSSLSWLREIPALEAGWESSLLDHGPQAGGGITKIPWPTKL